MTWAVAIAQSQFERTACEYLTRQDIESFLPLLRKRLVRHGRIVSRLVPLFPRYVFVHAGRWRALLATRGICGVIEMDGRPARLRSEVVEAIQAQCDAEGTLVLPDAPAAFLRGQRVRISGGALDGQFGVFDGMAAHERVAVLMHLLGRQIRVEVQESSLVAA